MGVLFTKRIIFLYMAALLLCFDCAEARRRILKGRKTMNRTYFRESAVPPWAFVLVIGILEVALGGIVYVLMKYYILDKFPESVRYTAAPISV